MGVDVNRVNMTAFALAAILGGIAGVLVGMYFQTVYPTMSFQAGLKGFTANLIGGLGWVVYQLVGHAAFLRVRAFG